VWQTDFSEFETTGGGIWRICAVIDYAAKYCLALTVTPTSRGADADACLHNAVAEATRLTGLADLRVDRDTMAVPNAAGATVARAFTGHDPLLRHVRTRVRSPQTNGVIERFFGTLKYEHLYRGLIADGDALAVEVNWFRQIYNTIRPLQTLDDRTPRSAYLVEAHRSAQKPRSGVDERDNFIESRCIAVGGVDLDPRGID